MSTQVNAEKVLVLSSQTTVLGKDLTIKDLANDQIGFFAVPDGKSFDNTSTSFPQRFVIAYKAPDGRIIKSAGQDINAHHVRNLTWRCYSPPQDQEFKVEITGKVDCETTYGMRVTFRGGHIDSLFGKYGYNKEFIVTTGCCPDCQTCGKGSPAELAWKLVDAMNTQSDGLLTANLFDDQGNPLADETAALAWQAANPDKFPYFTVKVSTVPTLTIGCGYVINPADLTSLYADLSFVPEFSMCNAKITETKKLELEHGSAYQVRLMEECNPAFEGNGYEGAYRQTGLGFFNKTHFYSRDGSKYAILTLTATSESNSAWKTYLSDTTTIIAFELTAAGAVPPAATSVGQIIDAVLPDDKYPAISDDIAACPSNDTTVNPLSGYSFDTDGHVVSNVND